MRRGSYRAARHTCYWNVLVCQNTAAWPSPASLGRISASEFPPGRALRGTLSGRRQFTPAIEGRGAALRRTRTPPRAEQILARIRPDAPPAQVRGGRPPPRVPGLGPWGSRGREDKGTAGWTAGEGRGGGVACQRRRHGAVGHSAPHGCRAMALYQLDTPPPTQLPSQAYRPRVGPRGPLAPATAGGGPAARGGCDGGAAPRRRRGDGRGSRA